MNSHEIRQAIDESKRTLDAADQEAVTLARILQGRLRQVSRDGWPGVDTLRVLKRELSQFNATTGEWKT